MIVIARAEPGLAGRKLPAASRGGPRRLLAGVVAAAVLALPASALAAAAPRPDAVASRPLLLILMMAALSLVPFALLMMTCFVRIAVVLSILRSAIGSPQIPPGQVVTGLSLILTFYVMAPTLERMARAVEPVIPAAAGVDVMSGEGVAALQEAAVRARAPLQDFLVKHSTTRDRALYHALALRMRGPEERAAVGERDLMVVVPAFITSELRRAFETGFLIFVPFLVIDMVIANLLLALGMHMLSPTTVSLPFKLLLFVMADGWHLVIKGLVESYV